MKNKPRLQMLHSTYWQGKNESGDAVVAVLKDLDTKETTLQVFENPKRTIYVAKPDVRKLHDSKKICEDTNNVTPHVVSNYKLRTELARILGYRGKYTSLKKLLNNPYVYLADIPIAVRIKQSFLSACNGEMCTSYRVGALDIETSMLGGKEILISSYISPELKVYVSVLAGFVDGHGDEEILACIKEKVQETYADMNDATKKIFDSYDIEYILDRSPTELDGIKWIFKQLHNDKPEFCVIWNISFDLQYYLDRIQVLGGDARKIMCHPDVPFKYRKANLRIDNNKKVGHPTQKWHVATVSGYTKYICSMALFSRKRKHEGVRSSYKLEDIATEVTGVGKLNIAGHKVMQQSRQVEYVAYNIVDTLLTLLIEKRNNDITSLVSSVLDSDIDSYAQQTIQLRDWLSDFLYKGKKVLSSWRGQNPDPTDTEIKNTGGNVLAPGRTLNIGVQKIKQLIGNVKDIYVRFLELVFDLDVSLIM